MAWYWPELKTPQSTKTAVVNAVGVSALFALLPFIWLPQVFEISPRGQRGRLWVALAISVLFAVIGWRIHRMSRIAALAGTAVWFLWIAFQLPSLVTPAEVVQGGLVCRKQRRIFVVSILKKCWIEIARQILNRSTKDFLKSKLV